MFLEYKSIENSYREKFINDTLKFHPVYNICRYIITEKLDGSNFSFIFTRQEDDSITLQYGKRSGVIPSDDSFYGYRNVVNSPTFKEFEERVYDYMRHNKINSMIVFGELFGNGIQSRIPYGEKTIRFFDIVIDGSYVTPINFFAIMTSLNAIRLTVPVVGVVNSLEEALKYGVEGDATRYNDSGHEWEGVVIKPYDKIERNTNGEQVLFYIKNKTEGFADKMKLGKTNKAPKEVPQELIEAMETYNCYLTENRLLDIFSKFGKIQSEKEIGTYIKYMMNDAKVDFMKDNEEMFMSLSNDLKAKVFSDTGKIVSKLLFSYV